MSRRRALVAVIGMVGMAGAVAAGGAAGADRGCPTPPRGLSPTGAAPDRYTMLIRVNKVDNARTYAAREAAGGLAERIRPRDVFVVNTRYPNSSPREWSKIVRILAAAFPCNRLVALDGLGGDPAAPGYAYALRDSPRIWAVLTDWERRDWSVGRRSNPYLGRWTSRFGPTSSRVRRWVAREAVSPGGPGRAGIVPERVGKWDYGRLARSVSGPHRQLAPGRRGIQSVQTQDACASRGGRGMKAVVGGLLHEYKRANFRRLRSRHGRRRYRGRRWKVHPVNLGVQVSFTGTAQPGSDLALLRTSPARAAKCSRAALKRGAGAILYWASPDSMRALLSIPRICALRPPPGGRC